MNVKKILLLVILVAIVVVFGFFLFSNKEKNQEESVKYNIVVSNFASYDFLRAIIGEKEGIELKFLLGPGKDSHSYEPTPQDIIDIEKSDLFVYVGGEMEKWANKVMESANTEDLNIVCIADYVDKLDEEEIDGAEEEEHHDDEEEHEHEEGAFDEHIWTSPSNAIKMVNVLEKEMEKLDEENKDLYRKNADEYIAKINEVDSKIKEVVDNKVRNRLLFGDKMPMQYFISYYNLEVSAAFNGCSTETEPSAKTIAYLEDKAREEKIPVILYIELNNGKVANTIANDVGEGCVAMQIQALHNVSLDDYNNGETWVSLMTRNIDVLKKALL
jgi:zinc transport system substrate-binding protein